MAALSPLKSLSIHCSELASNAACFDAAMHGRTLTNHVRRVVRDLLNATQDLAGAHLSLLQGGRGRGSAGEDYLVKTAAVHDLISRARHSLPSENVSAVRQAWDEQGAILRDALEELDEIAQSGIPVEGEGDEDNLSDGWDELGLDTSAASPHQRGLAEKVSSFIIRRQFGHGCSRLSTTLQLHGVIAQMLDLHKQIQTKLLAQPSPFVNPPPNSSFDHLLDVRTLLGTAVDELASLVHFDSDDLSDLHDAKSEFVKALEAMDSAVGALFPDGDTTLRGDEDVKIDRAWFHDRFRELGSHIDSLVLVS